MTDRIAHDFTRQQGIVDPADLRHAITVVGAGGIGSPVVFTLAKMGCPDITVIDDDVVEAHNLPNQMLYTTGDIGSPKAEALAARMEDFDLPVAAVVDRVDESWNFSGIVIFAVDSMASRRAILECVKFDAGVQLVVDARMGGFGAQVFAFDPKDTRALAVYENDLCFDDDEAALEVCTARAIIYVPQAVSALIAHLVGRFANGWRPVDVEGAFIDLEGNPGVEWLEFHP